MFDTLVLASVLLCNGLAAGVLTASELGQFPLMVRLPADQYIRTHAFFSTRYDPFMPTCLLLTVLGDLVLAVTADDPLVQGLSGAAALLSAGAVIIALTRNVPLNNWVRSLDPQDPPRDWRRRRAAWGRWNLRRCLLVAAALVANCAIVATS
ncbi:MULTISPECIES: anthrone oxygenase family protein [unclassified Streptomyces]|uniref:anthrone oxygenase family protein n=1 Tax=unclassified Streptomyces TaxID=2593676 RepID=UPI0038035C04